MKACIFILIGHYINMRLLLLVILFSTHSVFFCQNYPLLIPYKKGNLWGYCDSNKVVKIEPKFIAVGFFDKYERAFVKLSEHEVGFIDNNGSILAKYKEGDIWKIKDICFHRDSNYRFQLLDINGKPISNYVYNLDPDYHLGERNKELKKNYLLMQDSSLMTDNKFGLIDRNGKILIPFNMEEIKVINDTLLVCVEYIPFTSFKKYSKKQLNKLKNQNVTDTLLGRVILYTTDGKKIKDVCNSNFHNRGRGYGFYCYKDFFVEFVTVNYEDYVSIIDYDGNIHYSHLEWLSASDFRIEEMGSRMYAFTDRSGNKALYDGKMQKFISDFKFNWIYDFKDNIGKATSKIKPHCMTLRYDTILHIDSINCTTFHTPSIIKPSVYDSTNWMLMKNRAGGVKLSDVQKYLPLKSPLKRINSQPYPILIRILKNYYMAQNNGWYSYDHKLVSKKNTEFWPIETNYDKLFQIESSEYYFFDFVGRLITADGLQYWDN